MEKDDFSLTNNQSIMLGRFVLELEKKYSEMFNKQLGVDVEWAIDGVDNKIYIIQTRPETIHSNNDNLEIKKYILNKPYSQLLVTGLQLVIKLVMEK